ncbi:MAG: hypothetical protein AAGJ87_07785 [Pseudomonadota bacterium]
MTIICAIYDADARTVLLGCNSGSLIGDTIVPEHRTKWLRMASWAIAVAGRGIANDVLEAERAKFPNQTNDIVQVTSFMRAAYAKYDIGEVDEGAKDYHLGGLIAHAGGALYSLDTRLSITAIPEGAMWACGSGMEFALGADAALKTKGFGAQDRMETALLAAIDLDSGCPGEPLIEKFG